MSDHNDGIEELDNPLPTWWLNTFYLTIVFALLYVGYYWAGPGRSIEQNFEAGRRETEFARTAESGGKGGPSEVELLAAFKDPERRHAGGATFAQKCVSCHGPQGQGGIGPNLTDEYWLHGGKLVEIATSVTSGVLDKGMPPWGTMLTPAEIQNVVAFVKGLGGTHPANPKAPQGVLVKE